MTRRCINLRPWESRRLLDLAAGETAVLVRPVHPAPTRSLPNTQPLPGGDGTWVAHRPIGWSWRNPVRGKPDLFVADCASESFWTMLAELCPFGRPGDTLIGREACHRVDGTVVGLRRVPEWAFDADGAPVPSPEIFERRLCAIDTGKRTAAQLPSVCARHRLTIVSVEVKRGGTLQLESNEHIPGYAWVLEVR